MVLVYYVFIANDFHLCIGLLSAILYWISHESESEIEKLNFYIWQKLIIEYSWIIAEDQDFPPSELWNNRVTQ